MSKREHNHIPITDFISEKKLKKLYEIIEKSEGNVEIAYDRIESCIEDDFDVKDTGTNRLIFTSKKDKYKDLIFKVAGDEHGRVANMREFYNGDLDKRLTYTYAVDNNGVFSVQERVTPLKYADMEEYKKDVRDMLDHLSDKILLVDCKLQNFKNFGLRKNGDVCLLDHGDTVPLPNHQGTNIVDIEEESYVSLRCKKYKDDDSPKLKVCGGKLRYTKNYDMLECEKCGMLMPVSDAYRPSDKISRMGSKDLKEDLSLSSSFYEWKNNLDDEIASYVRKQMDEANKQKQINEETKEMKQKTVSGKLCENVRGMWIPLEYAKGAFGIMYQNVRLGKVTPSDFLKAVGLNPTDYKVTLDDHTNLKDTEEKPEAAIANKIYQAVLKIAERTNNYVDIVVKYGDFGVDDEIMMKKVFYAIKKIDNVKFTKYNLDDSTFMITVLEPAEPANKKAPEVEADIEDDDDDDEQETTASDIGYIVHGICCRKGSKYYIPVKLDVSGCIDNDDVKEALKAEGYEPKKFKIENNPDLMTVNLGSDVRSDDSDDDDDYDNKSIVDDDDDDFDDLRPAKPEVEEVIEDAIEEVATKNEQIIYSRRTLVNEIREASVEAGRVFANMTDAQKEALQNYILKNMIIDGETGGATIPENAIVSWLDNNGINYRSYNHFYSIISEYIMRGSKYTCGKSGEMVTLTNNVFEDIIRVCSDIYPDKNDQFSVLRIYSRLYESEFTNIDGSKFVVNESNKNDVLVRFYAYAYEMLSIIASDVYDNRPDATNRKEVNDIYAIAEEVASKLASEIKTIRAKYGIIRYDSNFKYQNYVNDIFDAAYAIIDADCCFGDMDKEVSPDDIFSIINAADVDFETFKDGKYIFDTKRIASGFSDLISNYEKSDIIDNFIDSSADENDDEEDIPKEILEDPDDILENEDDDDLEEDQIIPESSGVLIDGGELDIDPRTARISLNDDVRAHIKKLSDMISMAKCQIADMEDELNSIVECFQAELN